MPGLGGTRFGLLQIPPDSVFRDPGFDPVAAGKEQFAKLSGYAELMDPDVPGMHQTDTLDYVVVLEGEITLDLGNGRERTLGKHEALVQTGTRHAWRNKGSVPALIASVLIGVRRA
jgi:mannose-6-phosphate isomerase-like protein (cupin superfamily)